MPYITASIIFQLLTVIYEPLAKLQKEGELGRRKITQWTRYVTVLLGIVQSFAIALTLTNTSTGSSMVTIPRGVFIPLCVLTLTAGTAFIMWLGEQITERGIGNGMSPADLCRYRGRRCRAASRNSTTRSRPGLGSIHSRRGRHPDCRHDRGRRLHRLRGAL